MLHGLGDVAGHFEPHDSLVLVAELVKNPGALRHKLLHGNVGPYGIVDGLDVLHGVQALLQVLKARHGVDDVNTLLHEAGVPCVERHGTKKCADIASGGQLASCVISGHEPAQRVDDLSEDPGILLVRADDSDKAGGEGDVQVCGLAIQAVHERHDGVKFGRELQVLHGLVPGALSSDAVVEVRGTVLGLDLLPHRGIRVDVDEVAQAVLQQSLGSASKGLDEMSEEGVACVGDVLVEPMLVKGVLHDLDALLAYVHLKHPDIIGHGAEAVESVLDENLVAEILLFLEGLKEPIRDSSLLKPRHDVGVVNRDDLRKYRSRHLSNQEVVRVQGRCKSLEASVGVGHPLDTFQGVGSVLHEHY
mmetsp:Transcript_18750/g.37612  ORF Transcript_18750/g.37612 Transcript_18750/m.37612 type:complete len:361 (-) Transcript_18750:1632-2714(-)